jgi:hypothetical protein
MTVEITNDEAVAEIEILMERFGLSAETVVERLIIDAGCWMPMETMADSYWKDRAPLAYDPRLGRHSDFAQTDILKVDLAKERSNPSI